MRHRTRSVYIISRSRPLSFARRTVTGSMCISTVACVSIYKVNDVIVLTAQCCWRATWWILLDYFA